jgi:hypothetical protein
VHVEATCIASKGLVTRIADFYGHPHFATEGVHTYKQSATSTWHQLTDTSMCACACACQVALQCDKRLQAGTTPKVALPNMQLSMRLGESSREVLTQASRSSQLNRERPVTLDQRCLQGRCKTPLSPDPHRMQARDTSAPQRCLTCSHIDMRSLFDPPRHSQEPGALVDQPSWCRCDAPRS